MLSLDNILPDRCGTIDEEIKYSATDFNPKVVKGQEIVRGMIPWQVCEYNAFPTDIFVTVS